jgi:hypothetical protein
VLVGVALSGCLAPTNRTAAPPTTVRSAVQPVPTTTVAPTTTTKPPPTTTTRPAANALPTPTSTGVTEPLTGTMSGDAFLATGSCDHQRVTGPVRLEDWSGNAAAVAGRVFRARQCSFDQQMFLLVDGFYGTSRYPTIDFDHVSIPEGTLLLGGMRGTISHSKIGGGFWSPCPNCTNVDWGTIRPMPISVTDSLIFSIPPATPDGYHYEALHVMGSSTGMRFDNVRFTITGPYNGTQTGAILFDANEAQFSDVTFDFAGGDPASYYTAYIGGDGPGAHVTVNGCRIERGLAWYVYPGGTANHDSKAATWSGCTDWKSGSGLSF